MNAELFRFSVLGYPVGVGEPLFLVCFPVALLIAVLLVREALRRRARVAALVTERLTARLAPGMTKARARRQAALSGGGLLLLALALARPQCGTHTELAKRRGLDVVVALDASKSMLARDVRPSRIERAKVELAQLLDGLKGDRVGIVAFAGAAFVQCPLTSDYAAAKMFLRAIDPLQMPQGGTDIGAALKLAKEVLEGAERGDTDRVVVLLSDGEDLEGDIDEGVAALKEASIRVYTIGVGSESGEPIPLVDEGGNVTDYQRDAAGQTVLSRLDGKGLSTIAEGTGGEYFHEPQGVAVSRVISIIDRLKKSEVESRVTVRYEERYQFLAGPGLLLIVLAMLAPHWTRRPAA